MTRYRLRQQTSNGYQYFVSRTQTPTTDPTQAFQYFDRALAVTICRRLSGNWEIEEFSPQKEQAPVK